MASLSPPRLQRILPLLSRRVVAVDPGSRCLKILVADSTLGRFQVARREQVDLAAETLVTPEEIQEHLQARFPELAGLPLALVLGQNRCINEVVDLPEVRRDDLRDTLRAEAARLSGLPADSLSCEAIRLPPYAHFQRPHWLTLCKTREVDALIERYGPPFAEPGAEPGPPQLVDVVTTAHALLSAAQRQRLGGDNVVLVDLGANTTTVVLRVRGHGVFATSLPRGTASFAAALAKAAGLSAEEAERRCRTTKLLAGEDADSAVARAVETWAGELRLAVNEWLEDHAVLGLQAASLPAYLCGGGAAQPGLLAHVNTLPGFRLQGWPVEGGPREQPERLAFVVAEGAALHALGHVRQRVSLLPAEYRAGVHRQFAWEIVQACVVALLLGLAGALGVGIWRQAGLLVEKRRLTESAAASLAHARRIDDRFLRINSEFERLRPVFQRQRETLRLLEALGAVGRSRTNDSFWYVLFADAASYAGGTVVPGAATNAPAAGGNGPAPTDAVFRKEFIAEICIPAEGEAMRATLSQVVAELKPAACFTGWTPCRRSGGGWISWTPAWSSPTAGSA
jgi:Tfp pilus assembly PilM family ATPase